MVSKRQTASATTWGEMVLADVRALHGAAEAVVQRPTETALMDAVALHGTRLADADALAEALAGGAFLGEVLAATEYLRRAAEAIRRLQTHQRLLASLGLTTHYAALYASQLAVRERDWWTDVRYAVPYVELDRLREAVRRLEAPDALPVPSPAAAAPWWKKRVRSLRKRHRKTYEERRTKGLRKLQASARQLLFLHRAPNPETPAEPPADRLADLLQRLEEAAGWSAAEDAAVEFTDNVELRGASGLEKAHRREARRACDHAEEAARALPKP
jgi:hypothetical protein